MNLPKQQIDLRGIPCPLNFVRVSLALEPLKKKDRIFVNLDRGEPEFMVVNGLQEAGHHVQIIQKDVKSITILVVCGED